MPRKLKVYGWLGLRPRDMEIAERARHRVQAQCVVAAHSKAEVVQITGARNASNSHLPNLGETRNEDAIRAAMSEPGTVFFLDDFNHPPGERVYVEHPYYGNPWRISR